MQKIFSLLKCRIIRSGSSASLNNALRAQSAELRFGQAKLAEHLVRVLADSGSIMVNASGRFVEMDPRSQQSDWACARVIAFNERSPLFDMRVLEHLANGQNWCAEVIEVAQPVP